jgi:(R,R)-butanediol dehydrogenase / meso-butanediol dehydrogenase / diacetyl reductase
MKAAVYYGQNDIRVEEVSEPKSIAADQILIKPLWTGICGTDLHEYKAGPIVIPSRPHPLTGSQLPQILGHELSGSVVEAGKNTHGVKPGDRVSIMPLLYCGKCYFCRRGFNHLCTSMACVGLSWPWGGMSELAVVQDYNVAVIPDEVSDEQGAMIEPAAVAFYAVLRGQVEPGDTVLIAGVGPIGALTVLAAAATGAGKIYVSEPNESRRRFVDDFGVTTASYDPSRENVAEALMQETHGIGVDVAIECVGHEGALNVCFESVRPAGMVVQAGLHVRKAAVDPMVWAKKDLNLVGTWCYPVQIWPRLTSLITAGKFPVEKIINSRIGVGQVVEEGFEKLTAKSNHALKILVRS